MIRNFESAKILHAALLKAGADLDYALGMIWGDLAHDEKKRCRSALGMIMGEIFIEGLDPIERKHPSLKPPERQTTD